MSKEADVMNGRYFTVTVLAAALALVIDVRSPSANTQILPMQPKPLRRSGGGGCDHSDGEHSE